LAFTFVSVSTSNTPVYVNILKKNNERMFHSLSGLSSSVPDPDPVGSVDPDPDWESLSVSKKAKMTHKKVKKFRVL
jgi:hypothetical protein